MPYVGPPPPAWPVWFRLAFIHLAQHQSEQDIMQHVGRILRAVREARGLARMEVARHLGYGSVRKGVHRIAVVEATGRVKDDVLVRLLEVLQLDLATFEDLAECLYLSGLMPAIPPAAVGA